MLRASEPLDIWDRTSREPSLTVGSEVARAVERCPAIRDTVLEDCDDRVAALEAQIAAGASDQVKATALGLRHQLLTGRRIVAAERRSMSHLLSAANTPERDRAWLTGTYDHLVGQQTRLDMLRDLVNGVLDAYFASVSARLNEIVKTLTVVTTLLLPASLVAALYGMNFQHLPGADSPYGFWMVVGAVGVIGGTLLTLFRHRHWL
jgi:magnesium transporter